MILAPVKCPHCGSDNVKKNGTSRNGKQRFLCSNEKCRHKTFVENYTYNAYEPNIRSRIFFSIINGNGTRATARTLEIAKDTVTDALRSIEGLLWYVNYDYLNNRRKGDITLEIVRANEAGMEEMWSFAGDQSHQYWLWWAIDHTTGEPVAFQFGTGEHENLDELSALLSPFDIKIVYTENDIAYQSCVTNSEVVKGKENTQKIEREHRSLGTWYSRLVRKGIRFSKDHRMHKIVAVLVINFWFFQIIIW
ncbi:MAG: IS1 family transposase [Treponema sp.]|nr:IS1 family transposase [Treponema sp.]